MTKSTEPVNHPNLASALAAAQRTIQDPKRTKGAQLRGRSTYKYAGLDDLLAVVRPALAANNIAWTQLMDVSAVGQVVLRTRLWVHVVSDEYPQGYDDKIESVYPLKFEGSHHDRGSEITYARRYSLEAILGLVGTDDDDANHAVASASGGEPARISRAWGDNERKKFCAQLGKLGLDYESVSGWCVSRGWSKPSLWPESKRARLITALKIEDGDARTELVEYLTSSTFEGPA